MRVAEHQDAFADLYSRISVAIGASLVCSPLAVIAFLVLQSVRHTLVVSVGIAGAAHPSAGAGAAEVAGMVVDAGSVAVGTASSIQDDSRCAALVVSAADSAEAVEVAGHCCSKVVVVGQKPSLVVAQRRCLDVEDSAFVAVASGRDNLEEHRDGLDDSKESSAEAACA